MVVVDDGSFDGTAAAAEAAGAWVLRPEDAPIGPGRARDLAVRRIGQAAGAAPPAAVVAVVDADVVVHPDAFGLLIDELERDPGVVAAFGAYDERPPAPAVASRYANLRHHFTHQQAGGEAVTFWAGLGVVRRDAWEGVGGFGSRYERPAIEDIDLGRRLVAAGGRIRCVPAAQATHHKAWTLRQLWRTDVFQRALPWSRLIVNEPAVVPVPPPAGGVGAAPARLNTGRADQLSALAVHGFWLSLLAGMFMDPLLLVVPALLLGAWIVLNGRFLALLARRGGVKLLLGGGLLHAAYHGYASVAFAWVLLESRWAAAGPHRRAGWPSRVATALPAIGLLGGGVGLLLVAALPTPTVANAFASLGDGAGLFDDAAAGAAGIQARGAALGLCLLAMAAALLALGPRAVGRSLRGLPRTVGSVALPARRSAVLAVLGLATAALALRIYLHLGHPMRADEAQTFLRSAAASPLVTVAVWDSPNNHILHSVLMRLSVMLFGEAEWAVRLPAAAMATLATPLVFLGLRPHLGVAAALLAAAAWAGSGYALEAGTNARGYPIVIAMTMVLAAVAPRLARGRAGALPIAAAAAAVGAWAVPVMLLPFGGLVAYVLLAAATPLRRRIAQAAGLVAATGSLCLLLYAPALVMRPPGESGAASAVADAVAPLGVPQRLRVIGNNIASAWEQMAWPATGGAAVVLAVLLATGLLLGLARGGGARRFLLAAVAGQLLVLAGLGFPPLPWWSLGFAFPVALGCLVLPGAALLRAGLGARGWRTASPWFALAVLGLLWPATALRDWSRDFPNRLGFAAGPGAAGIIHGLLAEPGAAPLRVDIGPGQLSALRYNVQRRWAGNADRVEPPRLGGAEGVGPTERILVVTVHDDPPPTDRRASSTHRRAPERTWRFADATLRLYLPASEAATPADRR